MDPCINLVLRIPASLSVHDRRHSFENWKQFFSGKLVPTMCAIEKSKSFLRWNARSSSINGFISTPGILHQRYAKAFFNRNNILYC